MTAAVSPRNRRHDLDPALVQAQMARKIASLEATRERCVREAAELTERYHADMAAGMAAKRWSRQPTSPEDMRRVYDSMVEQERTFYSLVRVIELPGRAKRFILVYGDADDETVTSGTGPFSSLPEAASWYLNGGR